MCSPRVRPSPLDSAKTAFAAIEFLAGVGPGGSFGRHDGSIVCLRGCGGFGRRFVAGHGNVRRSGSRRRHRRFALNLADPSLDQRKRIGWQVILYLIVTTGLLYLGKKRIWSTLKH